MMPWAGDEDGWEFDEARREGREQYQHERDDEESERLWLAAQTETTNTTGADHDPR